MNIILEENIELHCKNATISRAFKIPEGTKGGEYEIRLESNSGIFPPTTRKIKIRSYQERSFFITADFSKESYSPGDKASIRIKVRRADGTKLYQL